MGSMRNAFQKWLFVFVAFAFLFTFGISYYVQTRQARDNADELIRLRLKDAKEQLAQARRNLQTLLVLNNKSVMLKAAVLSEFIVNRPQVLDDDAEMSRLMQLLDADEYHVVDKQGLIKWTNNKALIGYDFNSAEQSRAFMPAVTDKNFVLVQDPQARGADGKLFQYAGVARQDQPGVVQIGYEPWRLKETQKLADIRNLANGFRIGRDGHLVICEGNDIIASGGPFEGKTLQECGINLQQLLSKDQGQFVRFADHKYLLQTERVNDITLIGALSDHEVYASRNSMVVFLLFSNLILFVSVFVLVSELVQRIVITGISRVNRSLHRITSGDLDETVEVRTTREFMALSDGINSTVGALRHAINEAAERINSELEFARAIQHASLRNIFPPYPDKTDFDIFASMYTAKEVGGDFYDFFLIGDHRLVVTIADVSDKGIPAALFMMTSKTLLKNLAMAGNSPAKVFTEANSELCENNSAGMFVTAFMAIIDLKTGLMEYVNAGHNLPLLKRANGQYEWLSERSGLVLAGLPGMEYKLFTRRLDPGDVLFLYTDGVTEALNRTRNLYSDERLLNLVNQDDVQSMDVTSLLNRVKQDVDDFAEGADQADDITMLAVRYNGGPQRAESYSELLVDAVVDNLPEVMMFIEKRLFGYPCSADVKMQLAVAVDEIFSNIANYAYAPGVGSVKVCFSIEGDPLKVVMSFVDQGTPYNPLERVDPDTLLSLDDRAMGGLGVFMVKQSMDVVEYDYKDGHNVLTIHKIIH